MLKRAQSLLRHMILLPVYVWRWGISPLVGPSCRYTPSCSRYAQQAVLRHGIWAGFWLTLFRLLRCHPWGRAGYDEVPVELIQPFYMISQYWRYRHENKL